MTFNLFEKENIRKVELHNVGMPVIADGTYKGTYGGNVVAFDDTNGLRWNVTVDEGVRGFNYPALVVVKDGQVTHIAV